jgi:hypothetical protein
VPDRIETVHLFPELSRRLESLLESLESDEWSRSVSETWTVRSVVAHLLDGSLRRLSAQRDGYVAPMPDSAGEDYDALLAHLRSLNDTWIRATERLSPRVLIELIRWSDAELHELFRSLDPEATAIWPVAWAGESESENWFDVAREYTEKWHHIQQIFEATGRPSTIADRELMYPCLDTLLRALPHGLKACDAPAGTLVRVRVTGKAGGSWEAERQGNMWRLLARPDGPAAATVEMNADDAWKVLMKRMPAEAALAKFPTVRVQGDAPLTSAVLEMVCVMA